MHMYVRDIPVSINFSFKIFSLVTLKNLGAGIGVEPGDKDVITNEFRTRKMQLMQVHVHVFHPLFYQIGWKKIHAVWSSLI